MCHLHTHSEYSALDGLATIQEIIERAKDLNHDSVAITDHGNMSMALEFYSKAKKAGISPIIGMEAYQVSFGQPMSIRDKNFYHLLLLAKNNTGYKNLSSIATISQLEGYYYKPRIDYGVLEDHSEGLIVTTGCMAAEIPSLIREGNLSEAETLFRWYQNIFKDDFYVELQDHNIPELLDQNRILLEWAKKYGVSPIVTNDSHYALKEHASPHDIMLCIQTGSKVGDKDRMRFNNESYYMKSDEEMPYQEFLHNNKDVAKKCKVSFGKESYKIPILFKDSFQVLRDNVLRLAPEKYEEVPLARLEFELDVIKKMGFSDYFLIVFDLINFCKKNNIYYSIRGSAAGSVVSYILDITKVEPISNELFFERFLNPDRISMPDIDMDFADDQRHLVVEYTIDKYGVENVASIITFGTMATKAALKDSCRVLNIPLKEAETLTKLIPSGNKATDLRGCMGIKEFSTLIEGNTLLKKAYEYALVLENRIRNTGVHAAGIVISDKPIKDYVPLSRIQDSKLSERLIGATQFEMKHLEDLGLLKMDYLGLSTLTVVRKTIELVNKKYGKSYTFDNIPISHPKIWELLKSGDTIGVFQLSSDGMTDVIKKMQPKKYEHIVAAVALYRPGPMDYIPLYIKRLHGEEFIYDHPILEPILKETYGVCVHEDTLIITENGNKKIKDLKVGERVLSYNEKTGENEFKKITRVYDNSIKKCVKVKTRIGEVICTPDHKFFTQEGWIKAKDLKNTSLVSTWVGVKDYNKTFIGNNKARILGLLLSEGDTKKGHCVFYNKDFSLCENFMSLVSKEFDNIDFTIAKSEKDLYSILVKNSEKHNKFQQRPSSLVSWLREIGLYGSIDKNKSLKSLVYNLSNEEKEHLLSGLFDGDGTVADARSWGFVSSSHALSENVFYLLRSCGIDCYIKIYESYTRVYILDRQNFYEKISKISHIKPKDGFVRNEIKIDVNLALKCLREIPYVVDDYCSEVIGINSQLRRKLKKGLCRFICLKDDNKPLSELIKRNLPLNYKTFNEIEIEEFGEAHVYDIEVEDTHNYYGNNILLHNCVYQEQVMKMSVEFAGYTLAEADFLRKAIGKKDVEGLKAQEQKFIEGALKKGNKEDIAKKLWNDILPSARYSFNKAHAAVYAQLTCKTAYLKAMYPSEFIAEYIQSELSKDAGDSIPDIKRHVKLYPPTYKDVFCVPFENGVKIGTSAIKGISLEFCERIAEFKGKIISEFFEEVRPSKKQLEILINSGVLDSLWDRYSLSSSKEKILKHIEDIKSPKKKIRGFFDTEEDFGKLKFEKELITFSEKELMDMEFETFGFYISKSPQELALDLFKSNKTTEVKLGKNILLAGTVNPKYTQTKNGDEMAFLDLTDVYGKVSITVFPKQLIKNKDLIKSGKPLTIYCKTQDYNGKVSLLAEEISDKDISEFYPECFYVPPPSEGLVCFYKYGDEPYDIMAKINTLMVKSGNLEVSVFDVETSRYIDFDFRTGINPLELYNLLK